MFNLKKQMEGESEQPAKDLYPIGGGSANGTGQYYPAPPVDATSTLLNMTAR